MHVPALGTVFKLGSVLLGATKRVRNTLRRWMFLPTLKAAHKAWQRHRAIGSRWEPIGEGIEFSEHLARNPEGPEVSRLALRSLGREYDSAVVVVEAIKGNLYRDALVFDETRIVSRLDKNPRVVTLPGIPPYETYLTPDGEFDSTYSDFRVRITSLTEGGVTRAVKLETGTVSPLDQTLAQPYLWKRINSELYHIGEIVWAKEDTRSRLHTKFGNNIFSRVVSSEPVVTVVFWMPHVFRVRKFKPHVYEEDRQRRRVVSGDKEEGGRP